MNVHIRSAQQTPTDAATFAELANMASHDVLADIVGPDFEQVLKAMYLGDDTLYRARQVWFIDVDGEVAGMLCAFSGEEKAALNAETDRQLFAGPGARTDAAVRVQEQLGPISEFIDTVPEAAFYVQFLAVYSHARGNGYAGQLLAHSHDLARAAKSATLELDVETGNNAALAAYQRQGLAIVRTSAEVMHEEQDRVFALHRMVKAIA